MGIFTNVKIFTYSKDLIYKKRDRSKEDQRLHTITKEVISNKTTFDNDVKEKLTVFRDGSLADSFTTFKNFFLEKINYTYVADIYHKHEWFRLFGTNKDDEISNVYRILRKTKESIILVNGIPLSNTNLRLIEYDGCEYLASPSKIITDLYVLNIPDYEVNGNRSIFINNDGKISLDSGDIKLAGYDDVLCLPYGMNCIPKNYVCSENFIVTDLNNKPLLNTNVTVYVNKFVYVDSSSVKVYVPIKKAKSMFDGLVDVFSVFTESNKNVYTSAMLTLLNTQLSTISNTTKYTYMNPDITNAPRNILSDGTTEYIPYIEKFLNDRQDIQRNYVLSKEDVVLLENDDLLIKTNHPKILLPIYNDEDKTPLLYFNSKLFTASPEVIYHLGSSYIILDVYDLLNSVSTLNSRNTYTFDSLRTLYMNAVSSDTIDFSFEIVLYDNCDVFEGKFTKYNDRFVPIAYNSVEASNDFYEVFVDGIRIPSSNFFLDEYGVHDLDKSIPAIPVIYINGAEKDKKYIIVHKKKIHTVKQGKISISGSNSGSCYTNIPDVIGEAQFYYSTGHKINSRDITEIHPGGYFIKSRPSVTDRTITVYYNKYTTDITGMTIRTIDLSTFMNKEGSVLNYNLMNVISDYLNNHTVLKTLTNPLTTVSNFSDYIFRAKYDLLLANCGRSAYSDTSASSLDNYTFTANGVSKKIVLSNISGLNTSKYVFVGKDSLASGEVTLPVTDSYFKYKVAYLYSLWNASLVSMYETTLYSNRLFSVSDEAETASSKYINIPQEYIDKYNTVFSRTLTKESFSFSKLSVCANVFLLFDHLPFIPVPHGIFPKNWGYSKDIKTRTTPTVLSFTSDSTASIKDVLTRSTTANILIKA